MRESLTLKEVAAFLPIDGPGCQLLAMADALHARAGHVQQCLFRLEKIGAARVVWDDALGSGWWRVPRKRIPNISVRPGTTPNKPDETKGDVGVHEGGISAKRSPHALTLYGEDPNRPRPKLADICTVEKVRSDRAKQFALVAFTRADDDSKKNPTHLITLLRIEAEALEWAAEMVSARIKRLLKGAPSASATPVREESRGVLPG